MTVGSEQELQGLMNVGRAVRRAFDAMKAAARAGISTAELDALGATELERAGARSAPRLFANFPAATCISVNEQAAHGVPGAQRLAAGDIVNIDVSAELDGFVADMGESFVVGQGTRERHRICAAVAAAVTAAITAVRAGRPLNIIGATVQRAARRGGYRIVRNLGSHGVGRHLHEEPSYVPFDDPRERRRLGEGLVLTIEPFFTTGPAWVETGADGWTLSVPRGELVAQCEHTVVVTRSAALVVTA